MVEASQTRVKPMQSKGDISYYKLAFEVGTFIAMDILFSWQYGSHKEDY